jgi:hypothetical protein
MQWGLRFLGPEPEVERQQQMPRQLGLQRSGLCGLCYVAFNEMNGTDGSIQ